MIIPRHETISQAREYFSRLYGSESHGFIGLAHVLPGGRKQRDLFWPCGAESTIDRAAEVVADLESHQPCGVYGRMTTLASEPNMGRRGTVEESHAISCVWADLDFGDDSPAHKFKHELPLPPDEEAARKIVEAAGLPEPTFWVSSGHGINPIWRFADTELLSLRTVEWWKSFSNRWHAALVRGAADLGFHYKPEASLDKVMRVPGTVNRKRGCEPVAARLLDGSGVHYEVDFLAAVLDGASDPATQIFGENGNDRGSAGNGKSADSGKGFDPSEERDPMGTLKKGSPIEVIDAAVKRTGSWDAIFLPADHTRGTDDAKSLGYSCPDSASGDNINVLRNEAGVPYVAKNHSPSCEHLPVETEPGSRLTVARTLAHLLLDGDVKALASEIRDYVRGEPNTLIEQHFEGFPDVLLYLTQHVEVPDTSKVSVAKQLVELALREYEVLRSESNLPYAVPIVGPNVVLPMRGKSGLRRALAARYYATTGKVASGQALSDALAILEHHADEADVQAVNLRVGAHGDEIVIDRATPDGSCVIVGAHGWRVEAISPVLFRRTRLSGELVEPVAGGDGFALFRQLVNLDEEQARLLWACGVACLIPDIPRAVLSFNGRQGTVKTTTARGFLSIFDPSPVEQFQPPKDAETWRAWAQAGYALLLDNVTHLPPWLSDTLCRAVTGDGDAKRELYTDDDLMVYNFHRVVALTGRGISGVREDLAERLVQFDLHPIEASQRKTDAQVREAHAAAVPIMLGSLLDLLAGALRLRDEVRLDELPRLADYARVLACVDRLTGWKTLATFLKKQGDAFLDMNLDDPFTVTLVDLVGSLPGKKFEGTAGELLAAMKQREVLRAFVIEWAGKPPTWVTHLRLVSKKLLEVATALEADGWKVEELPRGKTGGKRYRISRAVVEK